MTEFHPSEIANNWYGDGPNSSGHGPCGGCEHRDCNLFYTPFYGYWTGDDIQSDVLLLGEAPGGNSDGGRQYKNSTDDERDAKPPVDKNWFCTGSKRSLLEVSNPSDNGFSLPEFFVEDLLSNGADSYYTNVKKCNDIHSEYGKRTYDSARDRCITYLFDEIDEVNPSVVVVFSSQTQGESSDNLEYCFERFGLGEHVVGKDKLEIVLPDANDPDSLFPAYESELGFVVIPAFHFTRAGGHLGQRAEFDPEMIGREHGTYDGNKWKGRYYDELSDRILSFM